VQDVIAEVQAEQHAHPDRHHHGATSSSAAGAGRGAA
jgi:hypothetical protein